MSDNVSLINDSKRNEFVSYGLEILKWAVLNVLNQQALDYTGTRKRTLWQNAIRQQLGIPKRISIPNNLVRGILEILEDDGYVELYKEGHWRITAEGQSFLDGQ